MEQNQRVLVVNGLRETTQVLKTILEPRGFAVDRIRDDCAGGENEQAGPPPAVVVLHDDGPDLASARFTRWSNVPRVIIGSDEDFGGASAGCEPVPDGDRQQYLRKPFQYGDLIRAIERLLTGAACEERLKVEG